MQKSVKHLKRRYVLASVAATVVGLSGCATVKSKYHAEPGPYDAKGLTYFLPERRIKITATRTVKKIAELKTEVEKATKAEADAKAKADEAKKARTALEKRLKSALGLAGEETIKKIQLDLEIARADELFLTASATDASAGLANASQLLARGGTAGDICVYEAKIELLAAQPDADFRFLLKPTHNVFRDDTNKFGVAQGLLSSSSVTAADRTADIIVEFAGAQASGAVGGAKEYTEGGKPDLTPDCASLPKQFMQIVDPMDKLGPTAPDPGIKAADSDAQDSETTATAEDLLALKSVPLEVEDVLDGAAVSAKFPFRVRAVFPRISQAFVDGPPAPGHFQPINTFKTPDRFWDDRLRGGQIFYRTPVPVTLVVEQASTFTSTDWHPVEAMVVLLPQAGPISYVPMNSSIFVQTVDEVQFVDGSISSWGTTRPSEALEFVRLPVRVLKAFVSVPAELIQLKVDYSTKHKSLLEAQMASKESEAKMKSVQVCAELAATQGQPSDVLACFKAGS